MSRVIIERADPRVIIDRSPAVTRLIRLVEKGDLGLAGWSPLYAVVSDGSRRVLQVADWTGGGGTKPATGQYAGSSGLVSNIANAVDIRGATGLTGAAGPNVLVSGTTTATGFSEGWLLVVVDGLVNGVNPETIVLFGGSTRVAEGKREAGGPWTTVMDDDILDLSVSNRFIVIVDGSWTFNYAVPVAPAGTTLAIKIVNDDGSFDWAGVTWPNLGTPPTLVDNANKITSLAFEKLPNGQWLGFVGPVHAWNGV